MRTFFPTLYLLALNTEMLNVIIIIIIIIGSTVLDGPWPLRGFVTIFFEG
jgi:hypothetical protein